VKHAWRYLAAGLAAYFLILVATFPVTRLVTGIETRIDGLSLRAVTGSLFAGSAGHLYLSGNDLGRAEWRLRPLPLLLGRLEYRVRLAHPDYSGSTRLGMTVTGKAYGRQLDVLLDPARLLGRFAPLHATGTLRLQLESFEPAVPLPAQLSGQLDWQDAALDSPLVLALGDIAFDLARTGAGVEARVSRGGVLGAEGTVLLAGAGRYRVDLLLHPDSSIDATARSLLDSASQRQPDGSYRVTATGTLQSP